MNEDESGLVCETSAATPEDLDWIFRLQVATYSVQHAVARKKLDEWYGSNPDGFSIVKMNGRQIGHLTIIPLRPNILESFVDGTILEQNIYRENLFTSQEKDLIRNLYVESIIIDSPKGPSTLPIAALLGVGRDFVSLIARICDPSKLESIYALAASGKGERFMKGLGFAPAKGSQERADQRTLYVAKFENVNARVSELLKRQLRNKQNQSVRTV